jgi:hypothetical protein
MLGVVGGWPGGPMAVVRPNANARPARPRGGDPLACGPGAVHAGPLHGDRAHSHAALPAGHPPPKRNSLAPACLSFVEPKVHADARAPRLQPATSSLIDCCVISARGQLTDPRAAGVEVLEHPVSMASQCSSPCCLHSVRRRTRSDQSSCVRCEGCSARVHRFPWTHDFLPISLRQ